MSELICRQPEIITAWQQRTLGENGSLNPPGGYMTYGMTGVCRPISESYPLLITKTCLHTHFYDEFRRKTIHFKQFLVNFQRYSSMFKENLLEKGPLSIDVWAQKPTNKIGTYPYRQCVMYSPWLRRSSFRPF